jgi:hypothetical protein
LRALRPGGAGVGAAGGRTPRSPVVGLAHLYNAQLARGDYLTHDGNPEACLMIC